MAWPFITCVLIIVLGVVCLALWWHYLEKPERRKW